MKIQCPVCGLKGHLQVRGNSARVQHYKGYENGKRKYIWHKIEGELLEYLVVTGSKSLVVNNPDLYPVAQNDLKNEWTGRELNPGPQRCQRCDLPG
jgi:hypothetical protein